MPDDPIDTADGTVKPQDGPMDGPDTEAEDDPGEPMTNEPIPVADDGTGLAAAEPDIAGSRGM